MMRLLFTCVLLASGNSAFSQFKQFVSSGDSKYQFGFSIKLSAEVNARMPQFRLAVSTGIARPMLNNVFYPAVNLEWQVYTGGFGTISGSPRKRWFAPTSDLIGSAMLTCGAGYRVSPTYTPLYYFTDLAQPSLMNPYSYASVSAGANAVVAFSREKAKVQRVAYINLHAFNFQVGYYNDGGAILEKWGDGYDRYYTGGGFVSVTLPAENVINSLNISYHKFTGASKAAFDISNDMTLANVYYKDVNQQYYNRSLWNIALGSAKYGCSFFYQRNNPMGRFDFQNLIHYIGEYGYHQIPYPIYNSYGMSYFYLNNKITVP